MTIESLKTYNHKWGNYPVTYCNLKREKWESVPQALFKEQKAKYIRDIGLYTSKVSKSMLTAHDKEQFVLTKKQEKQEDIKYDREIKRFLKCKELYTLFPPYKETR